MILESEVMSLKPEFIIHSPFQLNIPCVEPHSLMKYYLILIITHGISPRHGNQIITKPFMHSS
jgi:hypothetical protein